MKHHSRKTLCIAACMLTAFVLWTAAVCFVDVEAIGPRESAVGFAAINGFVHALTGVHMSLYRLTDQLSLVPLGFAMGFALTGLTQWVKRRRLRSVDFSILVLGGFYIVVAAAYVFFELAVVNYRPVLIDGTLEASYPSSTTVLVMCVMPTSAMQFHARIKHDVLRRCVIGMIAAFTAFMVVGRFVSGVHWLTDIIGGALLSAGLVLTYRSICGLGGR